MENHHFSHKKKLTISMAMFNSFAKATPEDALQSAPGRREEPRRGAGDGYGDVMAVVSFYIIIRLIL